MWKPHSWVFSVTKQNVTHTALERTVSQTLCVHSELIYTENWPNNPSADVIIEEDQSFPPGPEHKYWWFHHLYYVISMTFLCQCWLSLTFQLFVIISMYVIILNTECHNLEGADWLNPASLQGQPVLGCRGIWLLAKLWVIFSAAYVIIDPFWNYLKLCHNS